MNTPSTLQTVISTLTRSYQRMDMSLNEYLLKFIFPTFALLFAGTAYTTLGSGSTLLKTVVQLAGIIAVALALVYPRLLEYKIASEIQIKFHLFITHLTVLSMSKTNRVEIFRTIANDDDYGALADEMTKLIGLVDTFNLSLDDAARARSKQTPSDMLADFYEQIAYNVGSGQPISDFLISEQEAIIKEFATKYESDLDSVGVFAELFISMMLVSSFATLFGMIIPFLTGMNPLLTIGGMLFVYTLVQAGFVFIIDSVAPEDKLWYVPNEFENERLDTIQKYVIASVSISAILAIIVGAGILGYLPVSFDGYPMQFIVPIPTIPLLLPAIYVSLVERDIAQAEQQFSSFIRGLGAVESVKKTSTASVLRTMKNKDFGRLTPYIVNLYRRLNLQVNSTVAWRHFSSEIGSALVKNFSDMYVLGRELGGDPEMLGNIIGQNVNEVLSLRAKRKQVINQLTGQTYGMTLATIATFFISLGVLRLLVQVTEGMDVGLLRGILYVELYSIPTISALVYAAVIINALTSSLLIRKASRAHTAGALLHFTIITWLGFALGYVIDSYFIGLL